MVLKTKMNSILSRREKEFENGNLVANNHITWTFRPSNSNLTPQSLWGQNVNVRVTHIGFYTNPETSLVENIGLKVDKNDMLAYADYIKNDMDLLHITIKTLNGGNPLIRVSVNGSQ